MAPAPYVAVAGVAKEFPSREGALLALDGVDLAIDQGEFVSIIGPSGCGKTTLLRIIGGLSLPTRGEVAIGGGRPAQAQQRKEIGFVFQDTAIFPWRTVMDNIRLPLQVNRKARPVQGSVEDLVDMVGLRDFAGYYPHQISGGMRQRVALARALVSDPALLLMDEPLGSLDEITRSFMRYELLRLWERTRKTVVMVTHSIAEAIILSDRVLVMSSLPGRIRRVLRIDIPRPRDERIERSGAFLDYAEDIRGLLADGGRGGARAGASSIRH